jgi:hypothetical protein
VARDGIPTLNFPMAEFRKQHAALGIHGGAETVVSLCAGNDLPQHSFLRGTGEDKKAEGQDDFQQGNDRIEGGKSATSFPWREEGSAIRWITVNG